MLYRVKGGCTFGHSDQHAAGTLLELAPHEAAPFLDKLQPVEVRLEATGEAADLSLDTISSDGMEAPAPVQDPPAASRARRGRGA